MSDHAWEELLDVIDQRYGIISHQTEKRPLPDNHELEATVTSVIFHKADQEYKFERTISPRIIDKKSYYHRSGGANRIENIYDPTETSNKVILYRKTSDDWVEINPEGIFKS